MEAEEELESDLATTDDIRQAIEMLSAEDAFRLRKAALACLPGTEYKDPHEIVNEAIVRAMRGANGEGGRHWPRRVPFVAFMIMTMKSLADGSRESTTQNSSDSFDVLVDGTDQEAPQKLDFSTPCALQDSIEAEEQLDRVARAKADAAAIDTYFSGDEEVAWIILCIKEGKSARITRELSGMTNTQYETARKRLRRGIEKLFPGRRTP
ncbi:MAG: hypothetical protein SXG53_02445 [Pseudomonadota bacterium]|nr:hypothetical protein [Pseudomonadota bacterium]